MKISPTIFTPFEYARPDPNNHGQSSCLTWVKLLPMVMLAEIPTLDLSPYLTWIDLFSSKTVVDLLLFSQKLILKLEALRERRPPWLRQIITLILLLYIAHCKNVEPWLWKTTHPPKKTKTKKTKVLDHYLHHDLGMLSLLRCFFAHLLILQYPDHHQNLISSSLYYSGPIPIRS